MSSSDVPNIAKQLANFVFQKFKLRKLIFGDICVKDEISVFEIAESTLSVVICYKDLSIKVSLEKDWLNRNTAEYRFEVVDFNQNDELCAECEDILITLFTYQLNILLLEEKLNNRHTRNAE